MSTTPMLIGVGDFAALGCADSPRPRRASPKPRPGNMTDTLIFLSCLVTRHLRAGRVLDTCGRDLDRRVAGDDRRRLAIREVERGAKSAESLVLQRVQALI